MILERGDMTSCGEARVANPAALTSMIYSIYSGHELILETEGLDLRNGVDTA